MVEALSDQVRTHILPHFLPAAKKMQELEDQIKKKMIKKGEDRENEKVKKSEDNFDRTFMKAKDQILFFLVRSIVLSLSRTLIDGDAFGESSMITLMNVLSNKVEK